MVTGDAWGRITAGFSRRLSSNAGHGDLCSISSDLLVGIGVGITLAAGVGGCQLCASDRVSAMMEDLQFTVGQGPSVDACGGEAPVMEADLATGPAGGRWPAFSGPAVDAGVGAVLALPLHVGAARVGVLTLYPAHAAALSAAVRADAAVVAAHVTQLILAMQAGAAPGALGEGLADAGSYRAEVHQASGMISAQLGVGIVEALVRLRSYAYASGRPIGEVAADVVARRLRLED